MKKHSKKPLALSAETVRSLDLDDVASVQGAAIVPSKYNSVCSNGLSQCTAIVCYQVSFGLCG